MHPVSKGALIFTLLFTLPAAAALTDSEKAQVRGFVQAGEVTSAAKVRALVARPDLSVDEATEPLSAGFSAASFDERHEKLAREILVGPGSNAARSDLAPAVVRALLARASRALAAMPQSETGRDALRADELANEIVRIHRFVSSTIANAGKPPADGHDATAGFRDDALLASAKAYLAHIAQAPLTLQHGKPISRSLTPIRAQTLLTASDLARGLIPRHELSTAFALAPPQKAVFERHGTLIEDGGQASADRLSKVAALLDGVPGAADTLALWLLSKSSTKGLTARGRIASAKVTLSASEGAPLTKTLWAEDVEPANIDRELAEAAFSVAWIATRAAFAKSPVLKQLAERASARAVNDGADAYQARDLPESVLAPAGVNWSGAPGASAELYLAHSVRLLLLDPERALAIGLGRAVRGQYEPMTAFLLSLGVVTSLSKTNDSWGPFTKVKATNGLVSSFWSSTLLAPQPNGKIQIDALEVKHDSEGKVSAVLLAGSPPKLSAIRFGRLVPRPGDVWQLGKTKLEKLSGAPLGVVASELHFVLGAGPKSTGFDAVVSGTAQSDQSVQAVVRPEGRGGGLLVRGQPGKESYDGIVLLVTGDPSPKATLVAVDGRAQARELAPAVALSPNAAGYRVSLAVRGQVVSATIDGKKIGAKLSGPAASGRIGLVAAAGGRIAVEGFPTGNIGPRPAKPKAKTKP